VLLELRLTGLGAIDETAVALGPGFTAITGETGAGKTMLLTGLGLLLGERAERGLVRAGHDRAIVEGRFRIEPSGPVAEAVADAGGEIDGDELLVLRTVGADGRSRVHIGGRSVPVATVAALREHLVAVHGQADQRGLLRPSAQRDVLDAFAGAGLAATAQEYAAAFGELGRVGRELAELVSRRQDRTAEAESLRHGLAEIAALDPQPGEDRALREESSRLEHADALRLAAAGARAAVSGEAADGTDMLSRLAAARQPLEALAGRDRRLDEIAARLAEVGYLLADAGSELGGYLDGIEADPARLAVVQERLARLRSVTRRYAADLDGLLAWADTASARLAGLDGDDGAVARLRARRDALVERLAAAADALSADRRAAAVRLETAVGAELAALAMPHARLEVAVEQRDDARGLRYGERTVAFGPRGVDDVEFRLCPHTGAEPRPLHRGASGGELSRVMLALEIALAGVHPVPTFVFDEVDAGVGGRAAVEVGRRLAAVSASAQVLVVTHLPQVAAFADHHVVVAKADDGHVTSSHVDLVAGETRLRELSRMLGGIDDSELAKGHAEELLATAAASRPSAT
jgi:DNA repair protein RecN (Recombination protein N)